MMTCQIGMTEARYIDLSHKHKFSGKPNLPPQLPPLMGQHINRPPLANFYQKPPPAPVANMRQKGPSNNRYDPLDSYAQLSADDKGNIGVDTYSNFFQKIDEKKGGLVKVIRKRIITK